MNERDHLLPEVRLAIDRGKAERLAIVDREAYIPYPRAEEILQEMERLYSSGGSTGLLISAPSGNGKSTMFKVFAKRHPRGQRPDYEEISVLRVETPEVPGGRRFLGAILEAFGFDDYDSDSLERRRIRVIRELKGTHVKVMLVDEIHNLLAGSPKLKEETANLLKNLSNTFEMPIIFAGTERAENVFRYDAQLVKRFPIARLPTWTDGNGFRFFLRALESTLPLQRPSYLYDDEKAAYLLKHSQGVLADIVLVVREAARRAIEDGSERITAEGLGKSHFRSHLVINPLVSSTQL